MKKKLLLFGVVVGVALAIDHWMVVGVEEHEIYLAWKDLQE